MKYLKKTLSFVLALAMVFSMVIVPKNVSVVDAADSTSYTYFDTTMFKYDTDTFNKATWDKEESVEGNKYNIRQLTSADLEDGVTNNDSGKGFLERSNCIIVSNNYILRYNDGSVEGVSCINEEGNNVLEDETLLQEFLKQYGTTILWSFSESSSGTKSITTDVDGATNKHLYYNSGFKMTSTEYKLFTINADSIKYNNYNNYYLGYNNGWDNISDSNMKIYQISREVQGLYFNTGSAGTYIKGYGTVSNNDYNKWTGLWDASGDDSYSRARDKLYTASNLVKSELVKSSDGTAGQIQFNYPEAGIFDENSENGKKVYENVQIPFIKSTNGYYEYDSAKYGVQFNGSPASNTQLSTNDSTDGFFPFGTTNDETKFHFGMNMGVNFYMTDDGKINGKDIEFNFSGDDDVWVFVDGKLVLDIGGIHDAVAGSINFRTGKANVYVGKTSEVDANKSINNIYETIFETTAENWRQQDKVHTLQVFYLERGAGVSNCKIGFNLPLKDTLEVKKTLDNENKQDSTDEDLVALKNRTFKFQLCTVENGENVACGGKTYDIYDGIAYKDTTTTDEDGYFELKPGQTARFTGAQIDSSDSSFIDLTTAGKQYRVIEVNDETQDYEVSWKTLAPSITNNKIQTTTKSGSGNTAEVTTISKSATDEAVKYTLEFNNKFNASLKDDVVVLDYGNKVKINVLENDILLGATRKIKEVNGENCQNGIIDISEDGKLLIYEPTRYMNSVDKATYTVNIDNITDKEDKTANVSIMPANSVYYEDDFELQDPDEDGDPSVSIVWSGEWNKAWSRDVNIDENESTERYQSSENKQYGWDKSYINDDKFSNGSAHFITLDDETPSATATFTFTGTGVDVYTKTDNTTGTVIATLYKVDDGKEVVIEDLIMDNKSISDEGDGYYQIPTLFFSDLDYGTYKVEIIVTNAAKTRLTYYLDGIRVYNPLGVTPTDPIAQKAYKDAGEYNAQFKTVRDILLDAKTFNAGSVNAGAVFIDENAVGDIGDTTSNIGTYKYYGAKNEVYLSEGQSIAFEINSGYENLFIGAKAPNGATTMVTTDEENAKKVDISSASDMYYPITAKDAGNGKKYVVIKNTGDNILSITKIRATGEGYTTLNVQSNDELVNYASTFSLLSVSDTDESGMALPEDKGDVDIDNPDDKGDIDNSDDKDDNQDQENNTNKPSTIWNKIINAIKHWFKK